jgi:hypothetical protein
VRFPRAISPCRVSLRRFTALAIAAAAIATATPAAAEAAPLYPDLRTLPPRDLRFDRSDVSFDGSGQFHNVLRFTNTVWNAGPGKLENRSQIDPDTLTGDAFQRVYDSNGSFTQYPVGGFYWHAQNHQHYHYDDWGRYELWDRPDFDAWIASGRTQGQADLRGTKTTSCVMDEEFFTQLPDTPFPAVYPSGGCLPGDDNLLVQGLSVGWGDTYDYYRDEQWIDLDQGSLADGEYVLRSVTDPNNKIYESSGKSDPAREEAIVNEGFVFFTVDGGEIVDTDTPTGTVAINNVDESTGVKKVTVKVTGRDDVSGVDQVRVSADGVNWRTHNYTSSGSTPTAILCDLSDPAIGGSPNDGVRTIYAQFKDGSGKWGETESDTILYDPSAGGASAYSDAVLADEPVGYWRLGEPSGTTANDSAGSNAGVYGPLPQQGVDSLVPADPANAAAAFDGDDDRVAIPHAEAIAPEEQVTVEAWVEPDELPLTDDPVEAPLFAGLVVKPGAYALQLFGSRPEFTMVRGEDRIRARAPIGTVSAGSAYHLVGTYDGANVRLYVDGEQVGATPLTGAIADEERDLSIGAWRDGVEHVDAVVDDVSVYDMALSPAQVEEHWEIGSEPPAPPDPTVDAPSDLTATTASQTRIELRWDDNADNETEHVIQRDTSAAFGSPATILLGEGETAYSDTGRNPATTYFYRVKARNAGSESEWSNVASATTTAPPPPPDDDYGQLVLADDPVSFWRLGEPSGSVAIDQRAVNPGGYANLPGLGAPGLLAGDGDDTAVDFAGADDYMSVALANQLGIAAPLTLEAWIQPDDVGDVSTIVARTGSYALRLNGSALVFELTTLGPQQLSTAPGAIEAGEPHHVVATYDGAMRRLYLDGVEVEAAPLTGAVASTGSFFVGAGNVLSGLFDGTIDEVAVYSKTLAPDRVKAHYEEGSGIDLDPPVDPPIDPGDPPAGDPPPATTPPATTPPAKTPLAKSCERAIGSRTLARRRLDTARQRARAARRPAVKRRRQKVVAQRKAALRLSRAHVTRVCASAR